MAEKYRNKLKQLIKKLTGSDDVMSMEYKEITEDMDKSAFDNSLTIGNVNLIVGKFKTKKEVSEQTERFLETPLP